MTQPSKHAIYMWDFTIDALSIDIDDMHSYLREHAKKWTFQIECGTESGWYHYQGRMSLNERMRIPPFINGARFSPTTSGMQVDHYVSKVDTRVMGPYRHTDEPYTEIPLDLRSDFLRPWQQKVMDWPAEDRKVNVIVDLRGNNGKSFLKIWANCRKRAGVISVCMSNLQTVMQAVYGMGWRPIYIIDIPRNEPEGNKMQAYRACELIKDRHIFDTRYTYRERIQDKSAVWVFTNEMPERKWLSVDRWRFWIIKDDQLHEMAANCQSSEALASLP